MATISAATRASCGAIYARAEASQKRYGVLGFRHDGYVPVDFGSIATAPYSRAEASIKLVTQLFFRHDGYVPPGFASATATGEVLYGQTAINEKYDVGYGVGVFSASGSLVYSSEDVTWNQVDMIFVPRGADIWREHPALAGKEVITAQIMINPPPIDRKAIAHTITREGTRVHVAGGSEDTFVLVLMR